MENIQKLTPKEFKRIYTDERLRNEVAFAHGVCDSNGNEQYKKALYYPISYKVTEKQIQEAQQLRLKRQKEVLKENKHNLLFCGMGCEFNPKPGYIGNHRIRTEFVNADGVKCFIEVGTARDQNKLRIDFAIFDYISEETIYKKNKYNYKELESKHQELEYTYDNVLKLVNENFNCNFKKMVVDYYNIRCDNVLCRSPKKA